jgi:hypothetical protein
MRIWQSGGVLEVRLVRATKRPDPTAAQRKAAERARDQSAGIAEVRGIKAPIALHPAIKQAAREVIAKGK